MLAGESSGVKSLLETVLVTGAAGYLGSHAMAALLCDGRPAVGVDDYR